MYIELLKVKLKIFLSLLFLFHFFFFNFLPVFLFLKFKQFSSDRFFNFIIIWNFTFLLDVSLVLVNVILSRKNVFSVYEFTKIQFCCKIHMLKIFCRLRQREMQCMQPD